MRKCSGRKVLLERFTYITSSLNIGNYCLLTFCFFFTNSSKTLNVFWLLYLYRHKYLFSHVKFSHACECFPLFCGVLIQEIFSLLLCSFFPPFLLWILFCFHLPCSGNKADFYLYAQMLGRCNLVGFLFSSPCSLFLSSSPLCTLFTCSAICSRAVSLFFACYQ